MGFVICERFFSKMNFLVNFKVKKPIIARL